MTPGTNAGDVSGARGTQPEGTSRPEPALPEEALPDASPGDAEPSDDDAGAAGRASAQRRRSVLVELRMPPVTAPMGQIALGAALPGFVRDEQFDPVPMASGPGGTAPTVVIRGTVEGDPAELEAHAEVVAVWGDTAVEPFDPS